MVHNKLPLVVTQAAILQSLQKRRSLRVPLVGRKPREHHAVANGAIDLLQRDPMFGTIDDIVGNARFLPTLRISPSMFGKKERAVEQRPKRTVVRGVGQMHRDHAVVDLAGVAAVLSLDARGVRALLGMARFVDDADRLGVRVIAGDDLRHPIPRRFLVPLIAAEELLQTAGRDPRVERNRFGALAVHVTQLTTNVDRQLVAWLTPPKTLGKLAQKIGQFRPQRLDLFRRHASLLTTSMMSRRCDHYRIAQTCQGALQC